MSGKQDESDLEHTQAELSSSSTSALKKANVLVQRLCSFRIIITGGLCIAFLVLIVNVTLLGWAEHYASEETRDGILTISKQKCLDIVSMVTWLHMGINVLSTLLLGACTFCMQNLASPTREDVDRAHKEYVWLDIGVISFRNLRWVPKWKVLLWVFLAVSSAPLHLLYNSVISTSASANHYVAYVVTDSFVRNGPDKLVAQSDSLDGTIGENLLNTTIYHLWQQMPTLHRLENSRCLQAYRHSFVPSYGNVILVTPMSKVNTSVLAAEEIFPGQNTNTIFGPGDYRNWTIDPKVHEYSTFTQIGSLANTQVAYCLAEVVVPECTLDLNRSILITVIICNVVKVACLLIVALTIKSRPLLTTEDAMSSFLQCADPTTEGQGPLSTLDVYAGRWQNREMSIVDLMDKDYTIRPWESIRHRWYSSAGYGRWLLTISCCCITWIVGFIFVAKGAADKAVPSFNSPDTLGSNDFANVSGNSDSWAVLRFTIGSTAKSLTANILLSNLPQMILSFLYVFYTDVLTRMLISEDYCQFGKRQETLWVSNPSGAQRSAFLLNLPPRYGIAVLSLTALLHWFLSNTIAFVRMRVFDDSLQKWTGTATTFCGWSPIATIECLVVGGILTVALLVFGLRRHSSDIPLAATCSAAISAACHAETVDSGTEVVSRPLRYGVTGTGGFGKRRVGFSCKEVQPLVVGEVYQ